MKGLKKLALASAVAAAPFAQAELVAMDDALLEEMTGRDGVTIELSAQVSVGSFVYTDNDGYADSGLFTVADAADATNGAGTFSMNGITLGGAGGVGALDDIKIDIDIDAQDGLVIHLGGTNTMDVLTGGAQAVDFGLDVASVQVNSTTLASNISMDGFLGPVDVVIKNNGDITVDAFFKVTSGEMAIDVMGMGITNLTVGDNDKPIGSDATYGAVVTGLNNDLLGLGAPIATPGVDDMAYVGMTISTVDTGYFNLATQSVVNVTNALNINIDSMSLDITADVTLGDVDSANLGTTGRNLGSVAINDLDLSGTSLTIYGH